MLMQRMAFGALAGITATMAMTATMRTLFSTLPAEERYPLPPRELTECMLPASQSTLPALTVLAHFAYGAAAGALFGALPERRWGTGAGYGVAVWALSYLGWIPGLNILKPATQHPPRRDMVMIAAHLVWGTALAAGTRELNRSANDVFAAGWLRDSSHNR